MANNPLLQDPIPSLVIRKGWAMFIGIFGIILFTLVDTWFISLLGTEPLAAMSFAIPITFMVSSLAMGMGMGMSAVVGRLLGANQQQQARDFTSQGLLLSVVAVIALATLGFATIEPLFSRLGADQQVMPHIRAYMQVWYLGIPFLVIPMVGNAAIRASGDVATPSKVMLLSAVLNGVMDPIFIFGFGLGIQGAAIATALSWMLTFVAASWMLHFRLRMIAWHWPGIKPLLRNWGKLLSIGLPAALTQMLNPLASSLVVAMLASGSLVAVAAYGIGVRVEALLLISAMSLSSIIPTVFGQNYGAKFYQRASDSITFSVKLLLLVQLGLYLVILPLAPLIASWFSKEPEIQALAVLYLRLVPLSYGLQGLSMMVSSLLNSLHRPMMATWFNLLRLFAVLIPAAWLGNRLAGPEGVFWAIMLSQLLFGGLMLAYMQRLLRQIRAMQGSVSQ